MESSSHCTFCDIINSRKEGYIVFEDDLTMAFLDINPLFIGHTLLVPKRHCKTFDEMPDETVCAIFKNAKKISAAVEEAMEADGAFIALNNKVSQSVPHVHVHIIPRKFGDGLHGFFWPRHKYKNKEEIAEVQKKIAAAISRKMGDGKDAAALA